MKKLKGMSMEDMLMSAASEDLSGSGKSKGTARRFDKTKARKKAKLAKASRKKARKKR